MDCNDVQEVSHYEAVSEVLRETHNEMLDYTEEPRLLLYSRASCPCCQRVLSVLNRLGMKIQIVDIGENPEAGRRLIEIGGKRQVPCLLIDGKPKYESQDIITWLVNYQG